MNGFSSVTVSKCHERFFEKNKCSERFYRNYFYKIFNNEMHAGPKKMSDTTCHVLGLQAHAYLSSILLENQ